MAAKRESAAQLARAIVDGLIDPTTLSRAKLMKLAKHINTHNLGWAGREAQRREADRKERHFAALERRAANGEQKAKLWETEAKYWRQEFDRLNRVRKGVVASTS